MNEALIFLGTTLIKLYLMVVLLRLWLQFARADFYNPFSQFVVKATQPVLAPMRRVIPAFGRFDTATVLLALLLGVLIWVLRLMLSDAPLNPLLLLVIGAVTVLKEAGLLLFWTLLIRAILSWVSQGYNPIEAVLHQLTEPMLAPIRRFLPPMGGLDFSMLVLLIGMNFINILLHNYLPFWGVV
ncbi:YggT family protein [Ferrimonas gelatinilytica]|uniref:YggT family protein n=1 Tax=Ferrimonas gelatinilytica TaxID=1255257 RepID=A0ABP9S3X5_9GAMM